MLNPASTSGNLFASKVVSRIGRRRPCVNTWDYRQAGRSHTDGAGRFEAIDAIPRFRTVPLRRAREVSGPGPPSSALHQYMFERDGYLDTRITDIAVQANVAAGRYRYFIGKEEIFAAVVESVEEDMLHMHIRQRVVIQCTHADLRGQRRVPEGLQAERAADGRLRTGRADRRALPGSPAETLQRVPRSQCKADQGTPGLAERPTSSLDPMVAAEALSWMVSRMAYVGVRPR